MSSFTIEEYRIQREYRQNKRKQYLKRFQLLKQKMPLNSFAAQSGYKSQSSQQKILHTQHKHVQHKHSQHKHSENKHVQHKPIVSHVSKPEVHHVQPQSQQLTRLTEQNNELRKQLESLEAQQRNKLMDFKEQISTIKQKYLNEIKSISAQSQKNKVETEQKMKKITDQMNNALKKNQEIKKVNEEMKNQLVEGESSIGLYITQIKNEYTKKLNEFEKIFNSSNQKILEMEKQFNEQEFVQNALKNEDLLKTIQQNASKSDQAVKILEDYKQLLDGKNEILKQINSNIDMKQSQLTKMSDLQGKMKLIFQKMNEQKKAYINQNQKMTKQLMQIKELIMGLLNQAEEGQASQN